MRNVWILLLIVVLLGAVVTSVYFVWPDTDEETTDNTLYDAISLDAGLIIDIRDYRDLYKRLTNDNLLWQQLKMGPLFSDIFKQMDFLDSLERYHDIVPFQNHLLFSIHPLGKEQIQSVGYFQLTGEKDFRDVDKLLKRIFKDKAQLLEREYDRVYIVDVVFNLPNWQTYNFSYSYRQGIFVFSKSPILLESSLRQIVAQTNITQQNRLSDAIKTAGKQALANIYINYDQVPRIMMTWLHPKHRKTINTVKQYASWTELDLNLKPDMALLNGFTVFNPSAEQWLSAFCQQTPIPVKLIEAMPSTTYSFLWLGINNLSQYMDAYGRYLEHNKDAGYQKRLQQIKNSYGLDAKKDFLDIFDCEVALVYTNVGTPAIEEQVFTTCKIKSKTMAISMLESWQEEIRVRDQVDLAQNRKGLLFDNQLDFTAYKLPFNMPASLLGDLFSVGNNEWCVVIDNNIVFGSSPENLKKYLYYLVLNATLKTDLQFGKLINYFSNRSNVMFYCNPVLSGTFLDYVLKPEVYKGEKVDQQHASTPIQAFVYQLNASKDMLYNNLFFEYSTSESEMEKGSGARTMWESLLDTSMCYKPQVFQNRQTGQTEIFVQDMSNTVYLLNDMGQILWKIELPEPIISSIIQIDYYRNGKLQMLFNTKNYLYLIDRSGNYVEKYPVKLRAPACSAVKVFDYENNRNYRIFIATEDRKVYVYDKSGEMIEGWTFQQAEYPVQSEIYHFRTGDKDFIVFADCYKLYILDRKGQFRINPEHGFPVAKNTMIALDKGHSSKGACLVLTDTTGLVHYVSLVNGQIDTKQIKTFPANHFFDYQDLNGDGKYDMIYTAGNRIEAFSQDGKQVLEIQSEELINMRPCFYPFTKTDMKIGIVQPGSNNIYLYNNNGTVYEGFPLKGSTLFSIGPLNQKDNSFNLFVGSRNNFLYNYEVR